MLATPDATSAEPDCPWKLNEPAIDVGVPLENVLFPGLVQIAGADLLRKIPKFSLVPEPSVRYQTVIGVCGRA
ncbi:unannotated protein [freshwater metagenome]|uniref:Unannotated protein n=1 Tax=freshwater metagenome TaxID=449393 RepID=A0A6J6IRA2_9ZZZZ